MSILSSQHITVTEIGPASLLRQLCIQLSDGAHAIEKNEKLVKAADEAYENTKKSKEEIQKLKISNVLLVDIILSMHNETTEDDQWDHNDVNKLLEDTVSKLSTEEKTEITEYTENVIIINKDLL